MWDVRCHMACWFVYFSTSLCQMHGYLREIFHLVAFFFVSCCHFSCMKINLFASLLSLSRRYSNGKSISNIFHISISSFLQSFFFCFILGAGFYRRFFLFLYPSIVLTTFHAISIVGQFKRTKKFATFIFYSIFFKFKFCRFFFVHLL